MRDRKNDLNRRYGQKVIIILRSKDLIINKKLKPPTKTVWWSNLNGFDSWMAKDIRFWSSMAKTKLRPELDGQKYTFFFCFRRSALQRASVWVYFRRWHSGYSIRLPRLTTNNDYMMSTSRIGYDHAPKLWA